ncbi:MAG: hypothetical protein IMW94_01640 [Thermoanaerobacter sp.]|nr:hypothetical protein [Thermoanaerobacter sp.]
MIATDKERRIELLLTPGELDVLNEAVMFYKGFTTKRLLEVVYAEKLAPDDQKRILIETKAGQLENLHSMLGWIKKAHLEEAGTSLNYDRG